MGTLELKHAATGPFRMLRRLENFSNKYFFFQSNSSLEIFSRNIISADHPISELFPVPGGRHLVLLTDKGLEVLDLETNYNFATPWVNPVKNRVFFPGRRVSLWRSEKIQSH
jgi:hypothetical protein